MTKTTISGADLLSTTTNTYNAFHLLSTTDPMGFTTHYRYDLAGRKIEEWQDAGDNYSKTSFEYDPLGRLACTKRYYGKERTDFIANYLEYDTQDRITLEKQVDMTGQETGWTWYEYDATGNCTLKRTGYLAGDDADIRYRYNSKKELIEQADECGSTTRLQHNHGFINETGKNILQKITIDALNNATEEYYDTLGRITSILKKSPNGALTASTEFCYNGTGQKTKQIDHVIINGQIDHDFVITWEYDALDRIVTLIEQPNSENPKTTRYTYDSSGRVHTITKPNSTTLTHSYDALGRLTHLTSSDTSISYSYSYDLNNNPITVMDNVSGLITRRAYDPWNRLIEDGIEGIHNTTYSYDALGRLLTLTPPDGASVHYTYLNARLHTIQRGLYEHRYLSFDKKGRVLESALINNLGTATFTYDKKGRNITATTNHYSHTIPEDGFDAVGNLKTYSFRDALGSATISCSYDDLYQLTQESGLQNHTYSHDSINNRLSKNSSTYNIDALNKITNDGTTAFTYDKNGNLTNTGFRYDALDRLIAANGVHYIYDSFNRRIKRDNSYFLHQGLREIGTLKNGKIEEFRVLGLGKGAELGATIAVELQDTLYCPLHDFRGNIVALVDASTAQPAETYRYTAFGECEVASHISMPPNPWRFASKRFDPETGYTYFLRRYYSPSLGRWITPDPLGFADGPNLYAYVHNNPLTRFDLYGLYMLDEDKGDMARAMLVLGIAEESSMGIASTVIGAIAGAFQTDGFGGNVLGDNPNQILHVYDSLHSPMQATANAFSSAVIHYAESVHQGNIPLRDCHTAGVYASYGIGVFQTLRTGWGLTRALKTGVRTTSLPFAKNPEPPPTTANNPPPMYKATYYPRDPKTGKPLPLPKNTHGEPMPSSDTPHTQIGFRESDKGGYIQSREWGYDGKLIKSTDWSHHRNSRKHPFNPHDHPAEDNPTGGTLQRGDGIPFKITKDKSIWEKSRLII